MPSGGAVQEGVHVNLARVRAAYATIASVTHHTPILTSRSVDDAAKRKVVLKCENFQRTGSFKIRGALNAVMRLPIEAAARGVLTASSGNFAQGLAWAARYRGVSVNVVMPIDAPKVKRAAVEAFGGIIHRCEPTLNDRDRVTELIASTTHATFISPHDDFDVISGQGTVALELLDDAPTLDAIVAPVGGGGLIAGLAVVVKELRPETQVIGVEPVGAADAARSKRAGTLVVESDPQSLAKGLLVGLGEMTWPIVRDLVDEIVVVDESAIVDTMRLIWERMKIIVEPSAAVALAAVMSERFRKRTDLGTVGVVLTGGNLDLDDVPW